jgi:predicted DNA-binding transcriptional regulator YafY
VLKAGVWYLVAQDKNSSVRTYRARNIHDAAISDDPFERPKHFNLAAHWQKAVREYETGVYHEHADVKLSPKGIYMLDMLGPYVQRAAVQTAGKPDRKGWVRCTLPLESIDFGIRELMRLCDEVIVIGPPEIRARFAAAARRMAKQHGSVTRTASPRASRT